MNRIGGPAEILPEPVRQRTGQRGRLVRACGRTVAIRQDARAGLEWATQPTRRTCQPGRRAGVGRVLEPAIHRARLKAVPGRAVNRTVERAVTQALLDRHRKEVASSSSGSASWPTILYQLAAPARPLRGAEARNEPMTGRPESAMTDASALLGPPRHGERRARTSCQMLRVLGTPASRHLLQQPHA